MSPGVNPTGLKWLWTQRMMSAAERPDFWILSVTHEIGALTALSSDVENAKNDPSRKIKTTVSNGSRKNPEMTLPTVTETDSAVNDEKADCLLSAGELRRRAKQMNRMVVSKYFFNRYPLSQANNPPRHILRPRRGA